MRIDLDRCRTSAEVLDWIFQIRHKGWGDRAIADLLAAIDDVLDQQRNLRYEKTINPRDVAASHGCRFQ